ncbi:uncharacterized protein [Spinacia oleracea]|uniref:Reverse transcriptase domain-containing protein n=1 Tax=Spinacia oleracea TaxID=3562 RepID=A0ABM3RRB5_SPIOL|nr:uncharacterized protein LOC110794916 [Spinacia oleracea]
MGALYVNMFNGWCFTTNSSSCKGGRIVLAWNPNAFTLSVLKVTSQLIHCLVCPKSGSVDFCCTFVYAFNQSKEKEDLWRDLCGLGIGVHKPWIILGDFNCVLNIDERVGAPVRHQSMVAFRNCVDICGLEDVKAAGHFYTWSNKQAGEAKVFSKIDRVLANDLWFQNYPNAEAGFLFEGEYDHCPIVLAVYPCDNIAKKPFRYFAMWKYAEGYTDLVKVNWSKGVVGTLMYQVVQKLKRMKGVFKELNRTGFNDIHAADKKAKQDLDLCQKNLHLAPGDSELADRKVEAAKSKKKPGQRMEMRIALSFIKELELGLFITQCMLSMICMNLLGTKASSRSHVMIDIVHAGPTLEQLQKDQLLAPVTSEEVKYAMFSINGDKAPGPDGFGSYFFRENWNIVGEDVTKAVLDFFHTGKLLKEINSTTITLIPKTKCPKNVTGFRPISCCNVIYKCITKILCERMKCVLPMLIVENQGAFVHGRFIMHNIMMCQEIVRQYGRKNASPGCLIKLDKQKAYDTIEWDFLEEMLLSLGFQAQFVNWIMVCVTTPKFSIMLNGSAQGYFASSRGLRQGDPLSPLLFVVCMEYLFRTLYKVGEDSYFKFHPRCRSTKLTHLCFADDLILCCKGEFHSIQLLLQGFKLFSDTSGLKANIQKSAVYCTCWYETRGSSAGLVDKMMARIKTWSSRNLSFAGRITLINSVLLSIHSYWAQVFILPKHVLKNVEAICRAFLWQGTYFCSKPGYVA